MMKTKILNLIILDESGSMDCIRKETIAGCNEVLNTIRSAQKEFVDTQDHYVSIYVFQSGGKPSRYLINNQPANETDNIKYIDYVPCGCTPLFDGIGISVNNLRETADKNGTAIGSVTIITDGMENSSKEYTGKQIADLISSLKEQGWNFNFIGANINVQEVSRNINIDNTMSFDQTCEGTTAMFARERRCKYNWFGKISECLMDMNSDTNSDTNHETLSESLKEASKDYYNNN